MVTNSLQFPPDFHYTQSRLQDFVECPRRFYLAHIQNQRWPSPLAEPQSDVEQALDRGARFHQMVQRHQLGMSLETLQTGAADDATLGIWLRRYQEIFTTLGPFEKTWPEVSLSTTVADFSVLAKFDLITVQGNRVMALDWKTGRLPDPVRLGQRMQTVVYLLVLYHEATRLVGRSVEKMALQYVQIPTGDTRLFTVDNHSIPLYESQIRSVIEAVHHSDFTLTEDVTRCRFCLYRGLCGRGQSPLVTPEEANLEDYWDSDDVESNPTAVEF
ncbi:MAG: PD-(D/E)XK nuclease family protein [Chloroflexi bacterium]|nr:PD-(D/E)XK nuclease family protein [Chloroflexota bacterium]